MTLQARGTVPSFTVTDLATGAPVDYHDDVWQRRALVLVVLDPDDVAQAAFAEQLHTRPELREPDVRLVVTAERIDGAGPFTIAVADRWGEIYWVSHASTRDELPTAGGEVLDWLSFVQRECPECQGETR